MNCRSWIAGAGQNLCTVPAELLRPFFSPFNRFLLMRQKIKKYVLAFFVIFQPSFFFEQAYGFIGALQVGVVLNKMKQIPVFKAGIGKGDAITGLLCKYGCVFNASSVLSSQSKTHQIWSPSFG